VSPVREELKFEILFRIKSNACWDITLPSPLKVNREELCLPPASTLVSCSAYSSILKMEAIYSSETSVDFQRTTRCNILEASNLPNHRCENLKSYIV
jgi:hypothetical protein